MQSNSASSFDDDNYCDQSYNDDNCHTSSDFIPRSVHAQNNEPDSNDISIDSSTIIATSELAKLDIPDCNSTLTDSSTVMARSTDTLDVGDFSTFAETESAPAQARNKNKIPMSLRKGAKAIKGAAKHRDAQEAIKTKKGRTVEKKKKLSLAAQKKIRDARFIAGLNLETDD